MTLLPSPSGIVPAFLPSEFARYYHKTKSRRAFLSAITKYLTAVSGGPVSDIDSDMQTYLARGRDQIIRDLTGYYTLPGISELAPLTLTSYLSFISTYFRDCCGVEMPALNEKMRRRSAPGRSVALTQDIAPTRDMIVNILACSTPRLRCEILICCSSGLRISELLSLRFEDLHLDEEPARVVVRPECSKNGTGRHTYISAEAVTALRAYIAMRPDEDRVHLISSHRHNPNYAIPGDLVFPYSLSGEENRLNIAVSRAGLESRDPKTGRRRIHFHSFRKWFLTQGKRNARPEFVESWSGHTGYLASAYFRPSEEEDRKEYLKCELDLSVVVPPDYLKIKQETASQIDRLVSSMAGYQQALALLQDKIRELESRQSAAGNNNKNWVLPDRD